jgi:hypothetical protein
MRRYQSTAHLPSAPSGSAEITHPYHPLHAKRFPILKSRRVRGIECLILKGSESGTFAVARDWTNHASPDAYLDAEAPRTILRLECLVSVVELLKTFQRSEIDS